jgi:Flp pilus assembly protein TadB
VDSRIKSQRASVARVRELMDKATKLSDVVTLEGELSTRESDLEALLAQQSSLKDRTSLATITLSLSETPVKKAAAKDEDPGFVDALAGGWHAFVTMLRWIAVALGAVLPFAAGAALLVVLWMRFARNRLPRRPAAATPGTGTGALPVAPPVREEGGDQD